MNPCLSSGCICILVLIFLAVLCVAEDSPSSQIYIQGEKSVITNDSVGTMEITIKDIIPYFHVTDGSKSMLISVDRLTSIATPLNAAVVFTGSDGESISLVTVSNLSLSDDNKVLTLQVHALEFYEGKVLESFVKENNPLFIIQNETTQNVGIYLDATFGPPSNGQCPAGCTDLGLMGCACGGCGTHVC